MKIREYIAKLQNLPEVKKKIVLWTIVVVLAVIMGFFWVKGVISSLSKIQNMEMPQIEIPNMPSLDLDILQTTTPN